MHWGMIGGGRGSQIGGPHRIGAQMDGCFRLSAGALDVDPEGGKAYARELGVAADRAYGDWREMLAAEAARKEDRLDLVTVATPNNTHFEISKAFLEAGFNVLCEKPMTMGVSEAEELRETASRSGKILAVNFGYSGYPMAIQAREMIARGDLGEIRIVVAEFAHGFHAAGDDADNPRVRWRYDPEQAGISSITADCGIHAMHMAQFMTGQRITELSAQFDHCVAGRKLEDDATIACRFDGGARGRVWTSSVATGQMHGFNVRVFGSKGGLQWRQEFPNQLVYGPIGEPVRILERGHPDLYPVANAASRIAIGHPEGMLGGFANIYKALHDAIASGRKPTSGELGYPDADAGTDMVRAVHAAVASAANGGAWTRLSAV